MLENESNSLKTLLRSLIPQNRLSKIGLKLCVCSHTIWQKRITLNQNICGKPFIHVTQGIYFSTINQEANVESAISKELVDWAFSNRVSNVTFSRLLKILVEHGVQGIPKTSKTLLTAKEKLLQVTVVEPGVYMHYGIEEKLKEFMLILIKKKRPTNNIISLSVFIDNLPLKKSSTSGLWTILGSIVDEPHTTFTIGTYVGESQPNDPNLFLTQFVNEVIHLCTNGLTINNETFRVDIKRLICDAPAKCFILGLKKFSAYSGCTKCNAVGEFRSKKVIFPTKSDLRVDSDFMNDELYKGEKPKLLEIPNFGVVSNIPLDYMHLVCLGVTSKLISVWVKELAYKSKPRNSFHTCINQTYPSDFKYKARILSSHEFWQASQFRQFLLYYGPIMIKNVIPLEMYNHYLLLHVACRILCMPHAKAELVELAEKSLTKFIEDFKVLYGKESITHNIHGLFHLVEDYKLHGTLDSFSAFQYENYQIKLRNIIKKCRKKSFMQGVLHHAQRLTFEKNLNRLQSEKKIVTKSAVYSDSKCRNSCYYMNLRVRNSEIILERNGDIFVLLKDGKIVQVSRILRNSKKQVSIIGNEFSVVSDFYKNPVPSSAVKIFKASTLSKENNVWPFEMIDIKCVCVIINENERFFCGLLDENY